MISFDRRTGLRVSIVAVLIALVPLAGPAVAGKPVARDVITGSSSACVGSSVELVNGGTEVSLTLVDDRQKNKTYVVVPTNVETAQDSAARFSLEPGQVSARFVIPSDGATLSPVTDVNVVVDGRVVDVERVSLRCGELATEPSAEQPIEIVGVAGLGSTVMVEVRNPNSFTDNVSITLVESWGTSLAPQQLALAPGETGSVTFECVPMGFYQASATNSAGVETVGGSYDVDYEYC